MRFPRALVAIGSAISLCACAKLLSLGDVEYGADAGVDAGLDTVVDARFDEAALVATVVASSQTNIGFLSAGKDAHFWSSDDQDGAILSCGLNATCATGGVDGGARLVVSGIGPAVALLVTDTDVIWGDTPHGGIASVSLADIPETPTYFQHLSCSGAPAPSVVLGSDGRIYFDCATTLLSFVGANELYQPDYVYGDGDPLTFLTTVSSMNGVFGVSGAKIMFTSYYVSSQISSEVVVDFSAVDGGSGPVALVGDSIRTELYFVTLNKEVDRVSAFSDDAGTFKPYSPIATSNGSLTAQTSIATDGSNVYWSTTAGIERASLTDNGAVGTVAFPASEGDPPGAIVWSAPYLYWATSSTIYRAQP